MKRTLIGLVLTALLFEALSSFAGHCAPKQAALRAAHSCCGSPMGHACAAACARESSNQRYDMRALAPEPTFKAFSTILAYPDLTVPVTYLAAAGFSPETSPAPISRRYLLTCTLRL